MLKSSSTTFINILNLGNNNVITFNGNNTFSFRGNNAFSSRCNNENMKMFNHKWAETGREDVKLKGIDLSGIGEFEIRIPLAEECDINISGSSSVFIHGNNPGTSLDIDISGSGSISGRGVIKNFFVRISGSGNVNGFLAKERLKVNILGSGNVFVNCLRDCKIRENTPG